jgi:ABC-type amino acid transport substrate-binding protein
MGYLPRRCVPAASLLAAAVLLTTAAGAQTGGSEGLSPTLANIKRGHVVRLGYRESSPPFSFLDQANRPIGYSLELCEAIVEEIGVEVDDPNVKIDHRQCGAWQTGGVFAADVRRRHQADGAEGLYRLGRDRFEGQDRGGDKGHHQRAGDA